jgi:hypothetical protein
MAGIVPKFMGRSITCDVVEAVTGGQVVEARAASGAATQRPVGVAAAGSTTVRGVALIDATNATQSAALVYPLPVSTTVLVEGGGIPVTYAANANDGAALKAAAAGKVTPWVSGTDAADLIIGYCDQAGGVTSSGTTVGTMRLNRA